MDNNTTTPPRYDFSDVELVGHLDLVGQAVCSYFRGQEGEEGYNPDLGVQNLCKAITLLRTVRDDLAAKANLSTKPIYHEPAYIADCEMRNMTDEGIFNRDEPYKEDEA